MLFSRRFVAPCLVSALLAFPLGAQQPPTPPPASTAAATPKLSIAELQKLAEAQVAIAVVLDSSGAELSKVKNKTPQAQTELQAKRKTLVSDALAKRGLTVEEFDRRRYLVSTDTRLRFQLDSMVAKMTGAPLPGTVIANAAAPAMAAPVTLVQIAVSYVAANYLDTPDKSGLLIMAQTEARVASQHAGFMTRALDNLQTMQMHAGHVLHAMDPSTMPQATAPGKGYGVKRALAGVIAYSELAATLPGASPNVKTHTAHILAAAKSTTARADQIIALTKKIQSSTTAAAAAPLVGQLTSLCNELVAGNDLNHDGKIVFGDGEGGLQQAQDHMNLLLAGERAR